MVEKRIENIIKCMESLDISVVFRELPSKIRAFSLIVKASGGGVYKFIVINEFYKTKVRILENIVKHEFYHLCHPETMHKLNASISLINNKELERIKIESMEKIRIQKETKNANNECLKLWKKD